MSKLTQVMSAVLYIPEDSITAETSPQNTPSWDSLNSIILLTEIEKTYELRFELAEAMSVKNVSDILALLASKGLDPHA